MLAKIDVRSFKPLHDARVELGWVTVLVGANGNARAGALATVAITAADPERCPRICGHGA